MSADVRLFERHKADGTKFPMITCYDYPSARAAVDAGIEVILVGDSAAMVVHGHSTTIPMTLDLMVAHCQAVTRGAPDALVVGDLPFMTYSTIAETTASARRLMQEGGVQAVKLEGGQAQAANVEALTANGVPVVGHLGFTPQSQYLIGTRMQGKDDAGAERLKRDAAAIQAAGAVAVVLELVPEELSREITENLSIPTIGIGAGPYCDGQVQVWHDVLGLSQNRPPKHAKQYATANSVITEALRSYATDVRDGTLHDR